MPVATKETSGKMKYQAVVNTFGQMQRSTTETGLRTKCMETEICSGKTENTMKVSLLMTSVKVTENSLGKTVGSTKDNG